MSYLLCAINHGIVVLGDVDLVFFGLSGWLLLAFMFALFVPWWESVWNIRCVHDRYLQSSFNSDAWAVQGSVMGFQSFPLV